MAEDRGERMRPAAVGRVQIAAADGACLDSNEHLPRPKPWDGDVAAFEHGTRAGKDRHPREIRRSGYHFRHQAISATKAGITSLLDTGGPHYAERVVRAERTHEKLTFGPVGIGRLSNVTFGARN
jgi:hypothetical protein